jgi:hypothetical protein
MSVFVKVEVVVVSVADEVEVCVSVVLGGMVLEVAVPVV